MQLQSPLGTRKDSRNMYHANLGPERQLDLLLALIALRAGIDPLILVGLIISVRMRVWT
ncbi:MAG: hypothetical protein LC808_30615 [Actinobacteria bacterium]|nr:hypothetical protein [Actinomycetota bacterium]